MCKSYLLWSGNKCYLKSMGRVMNLICFTQSTNLLMIRILKGSLKYAGKLKEKWFSWIRGI